MKQRKFRFFTLGHVEEDCRHRKLLDRYHQGLRNLSERPGLLGLFSTKLRAINDPQTHYLIKMIDSENWSALDVDVKGEVYEGLLAKNAMMCAVVQDILQAATVIRAIVEVMRLTVDGDFRSGVWTGGFCWQLLSI